MPIKKLLSGASTVIALIAVVTASIGLVHELLSNNSLDRVVHIIESWSVTAGYHTALILLAAAGVQYLLNKK